MHGGAPWKAWISTVDSCASILDLLGAQTNTHTVGGRGWGAGVGKSLWYVEKPHLPKKKKTTSREQMQPSSPSTDSSWCLWMSAHARSLQSTSTIYTTFGIIIIIITLCYLLLISSSLFQLYLFSRGFLHSEKPSSRNPKLGWDLEITGLSSGCNPVSAEATLRHSLDKSGSN